MGYSRHGRLRRGGKVVTELGLDWLGVEDVNSDVPVRNLMRNLRRRPFGAEVLM